MKAIKKKAYRNALIVAIIIWGVGLIICNIKEFEMSHPLRIIFLPFWSIILAWITYSATKRHYRWKDSFFADKNYELSKQKSNWRLFKIYKTKQYSKFFLLSSIVMVIIELFEKTSEIHISKIIFWGITILCALLTFLFSKRLEKREINNEKPTHEYR